MATVVGQQPATPGSSIPPTQNTAPVLEFNCLYTHDLRRKQKRWQDGIVRFHTFNKRVMVYDIPRNFIGDTHWSSTDELRDGDELTLDKGGVLVQVAESTGRYETDLSELRKSAKKIHKRPLAGTRPLSPIRIIPDNTTRPDLSACPKHTSLKTLLGKNRPPIGKAVLPTLSPFELRRAREDHDAASISGVKPVKRQRSSKSSGRQVDEVRIEKGAQPGDKLRTFTRAGDLTSSYQSPRIVKCIGAGETEQDSALLDHCTDPKVDSSPVREIVDCSKQGNVAAFIHASESAQTQRKPNVLKVDNRSAKKTMLVCGVPAGRSGTMGGEVSLSTGDGITSTPANTARQDYGNIQAQRLRARLDRVRGKRSKPANEEIIAPHVIDPASPEETMPSKHNAAYHQHNPDVMPGQKTQVDHVEVPRVTLIDVEPASISTIVAKVAHGRAKKAHISVPTLDTSATGTSQVLLRKPFQRPGKLKTVDKVGSAVATVEPDPWSREAFDLLLWRPPGWNEEEWRIDTPSIEE